MEIEVINNITEEEITNNQEFYIFNIDLDVYGKKYNYDEVKAAAELSCLPEAEDLDYEDIMIIANAIYWHWVDGRDESEDEKYATYPWLEFESDEEDGYIQAYAKRAGAKFIDLYLTTVKNI